ncbi:hypothetical protein DPEC_G00114930 [Dallia pectoralis]|uniref:Uncharacterized protein n=1 Tax=Dallia pectoralis TaxID=75939 RepID=A0ACC2GU78_DALPE|nr:hypothetical protein DPEC_G00114930 [Dallia pectoralis]
MHQNVQWSPSAVACSPNWILGRRSDLVALKPPRCLSHASSEHRHLDIGTMRSACLSLLLVTACWSLPFQQTGFMDFMMEDDPGSGSPDIEDKGPPEVPEGPKCPFRCQCHLQVTQCSDLGLKSVPEEIAVGTTLLDLQNNKITEIKENDFKSLKGLTTLILVNNHITTIHAKAFISLGKLQRLYLSKNHLKNMPSNMPKNLQELRIHENQITKIKKASFEGMAQVIVMELGSNPLNSAGVEAGAFGDLKRVSYIRIADTNLTEIPKDLPPSLSELHLDGNKITKVQADSLKGLKNLAKLGLGSNEISQVENGSLAMVPSLRELHLDNNILTTVPPGLAEHKYIQVVYLHSNKIGVVGTEDFCPPGYNTKKAMYSGISLFANPVPYWEVQPITFRCVFDRSAIQLGNYRKKDIWLFSTTVFLPADLLSHTQRERERRERAMFPLRGPILALLVSLTVGQYDYEYGDYQPYAEQSASSPNCARECECPIQFPTAMYCDSRNLNFVPVVPSGIKYLYLQNNQIKEIKAGVFDNVTAELRWLVLDHNQITSDKVAKGTIDKLTGLEKFHFSHNNLTEAVIPPSKLLEELKMMNNQLTKFPKAGLVGMKNLTSVSLQNNKLTTESLSGAFKNLNSLVLIDVTHNKLKKLPSGMPVSLEMFYADFNEISAVSAGDLKELPKLAYLRLANNKLTDSGIPAGVFNLTNLVELDLSYNKLKAIPEINEQLEHLYLQVNKINKFDLASICKFSGPLNYSRLKHLRLDGNNITQADLPDESTNCLRQASDIIVSWDGLEGTVESRCDAQMPPVLLSSRSVPGLTLCMRQLMKLLLVLSSILLLVSSALAQSADMPYEEYMAQLQACPKQCRCPHSFPKAVYCDNKALHRIPIIPPYTWYLYLQNNLIEEVSADAFRNATKLRWINLNHNLITTMEEGALAAMSHLVHLYMDDNRLTSVPANLPSSLEQLRLARNRISKIPVGVFSDLHRVTLLELQGNKLQDDAVTEVSLKGLSNLVQINLAKNQLTAMPLGLPVTTTQLFLDGNAIEKIPTDYFKSLPKVAFLRLNRNKLVNTGLPRYVFNVSSILELQLSYNQLTEVPIISGGLEHLYLDHNQIKIDHLASYATETAPKLRYLRLDGNEIKPPIPRDLMMCFRLLSLDADLQSGWQNCSNLSPLAPGPLALSISITAEGTIWKSRRQRRTMRMLARLVLGLFVLKAAVASPRFARQVELDSYESSNYDEGPDNLNNYDYDNRLTIDEPRVVETMQSGELYKILSAYEAKAPLGVHCRELMQMCIEIGTLAPPDYYDPAIPEQEEEEEEKEDLSPKPQLIPQGSGESGLLMGPNTQGEEELRLSPIDILPISGDNDCSTGSRDFDGSGSLRVSCSEKHLGSGGSGGDSEVSGDLGFLETLFPENLEFLETLLPENLESLETLFPENSGSVMITGEEELPPISVTTPPEESGDRDVSGAPESGDSGSSEPEVTLIPVTEGMPTCLLCTCLGSSVYCDDVKLTSVPPLPKETTHFYARYNQITKINKGDFAQMNKLKRIDLTANAIMSVADNAFSALPVLEELLLRENSLAHLPALPNTMTLIDGSHNNIGASGIHKEAFKDMAGLQYLYLDDNQINHIPVPLPDSLRSLHLQRNNIQMMHEDTFCNLKDFNYIRNALEDIRLDGNPINLSNTPQAYVCLPRVPIGALI